MNYKFTFYVGLNDKDTKVQEISTIEAYKMCMKTIGRYAEGGTIFEADGFYTHEDKTVVIEKSLKIEVLFIDMETAHKIVEELKLILNQESVVVGYEPINSELW